MILVSGAGSFIGRAVCRNLRPGTFRAASHRQIGEPGLLDGISKVIHAGRNAFLGTAEYRLYRDVELQLAERCAGCNIPLLSLGSRKVYAPSSQACAETSPLGPGDRYGEQKLAIEQALIERHDAGLTRLRLSNIFGFEPGRATFFGIMLTRLLREHCVQFDTDPRTERDFLPVELAGRAIAILAENPPGGVVNIGSGIGTTIGKLAESVIEGFGQGRLIIDEPRSHDGFVLDVERMRQLTGLQVKPGEIIESAKEAGRELRKTDSV